MIAQLTNTMIVRIVSMSSADIWAFERVVFKWVFVYYSSMLENGFLNVISSKFIGRFSNSV